MRDYVFITNLQEIKPKYCGTVHSISENKKPEIKIYDMNFKKTTIKQQCNNAIHKKILPSITKKILLTVAI